MFKLTYPLFENNTNTNTNTNTNSVAQNNISTVENLKKGQECCNLNKNVVKTQNQNICRKYK